MDDDSNFGVVAKRILEMQGPFQVDSALSVKEAFERITEKELPLKLLTCGQNKTFKIGCNPLHNTDLLYSAGLVNVLFLHLNNTGAVLGLGITFQNLFV